MSCLEHQRLSKKDFKHIADFEYLIEQDLPCFSIEVKRGQMSLVVGHYLAKILLPSGISLEILPKLTTHTVLDYKNTLFDYKNTRVDQEIVQARLWVSQMLQDIGSDYLAKKLSAVTVASTYPDIHSRNFSDHPSTSADWVHTSNKYEQLPPITPQFIRQARTKPYSDIEPWYANMLETISRLIVQAAGMLPNQYQTQINNQPRAQGKVNLSVQLKQNWHRPHYLYTEQAVFSSDRQLAELFSTAWLQLQKLSIGNGLGSRQKIPSGLQGIKVLPPQRWSTTLQQIQSTMSVWITQFSPSQAQTLMQAVQWTRWLLLSTMDKRLPKHGLQQQAAKMPIPAILINMNHAFERWVLGKLDKWVSDNLSGSRLIIQPSFAWLSLNQPSSENDIEHNSKKVIKKLIPDACVLNKNGDISHVMDIKYKTIESIQQVSGSDWQQLYVYQKHLKCQQGWLIYPKTINFTQRLDVYDYLNENRQSNQKRSTHMSVIPFDPYQGLLLI